MTRRDSFPSIRALTPSHQRGCGLLRAEVLVILWVLLEEALHELGLVLVEADSHHVG